MLRCIEIGNDTVFQRTDRLDVFVGFPMHLSGFVPGGNDPVARSINGDDGWCVHHDLIVVNDQCVRRSKVDRNVLCEEFKKAHAGDSCGLMFEVSVSGEDHGHVAGIAKVHRQFVFDRTSGLYHSFDPRLVRDLHAVWKGEKGI